MNLKKIFQEKRYGFYVTLSLILLTLVTAIIYVSTYTNVPRDYRIGVTISLFISFAVGLILVGLNQSKYAPYVLGVLNFLALLFYVDGVYLYVSEIYADIDVHGGSATFYVNTIFIALTFVLSIVDIFLPQVKLAGEKAKKSIRVTNVVTKSVMTLATALFGIILTGSNIASANRVAISNELKQKIFEVRGKNDEKKYFTSKYKNIAELIAAGKAENEKVQANGSVLIKNDGALPLDVNTEKKISLFGYNTIRPAFGGRGSSAGRGGLPSTTLVKALTNAGFEVNTALVDYYNDAAMSTNSTYYTNNDMPFYKKDASDKFNAVGNNEELLATLGEYGNVAIYNIARTSGEARDISNTDESDYLDLTANEKSVLKGLSDLKSKNKIKKVIVLLNTTNQIKFKEFASYDIDAMLWIGHPGTNGFSGVAQILDGTVNPSGRLPDTWWYDHDDNPVMKGYGEFKYTNAEEYRNKIKNGNSSFDGFTTYAPYLEGVYLGYRYAETRYTDAILDVNNAAPFVYDNVISHPFGYGLSYSTFEVGTPTITRVGDDYQINVRVNNTSDVPGKYTVQVYMQRPYTEFDKTNDIEKPAVELANFYKTDLIPGQGHEDVTITVNESMFKTYDAHVNKTYILEAGKYGLTVADNSHEAAKNFLEKSGVNVGGNAAAASYFDLEENLTKYASITRDGKTIEITNRFDINDVNMHDIYGSENHLNFMTRKDWSRSLDHSLKLTDAMVAEMNKSQTFTSVKPSEGEYPTYGENKGIALIKMKDVDYNDTEKWDEFLNQLTWDDTVNLLKNGLRQTGAVDSVAKPGTVDHNGPTGISEIFTTGHGLAVETNDPMKEQKPPRYPSVPIIAATFDREIAAEVGNMFGEDALWAGYNGFYGIGLNAHRSPYAGRLFEYYSEDPLLSGLLSAELVKKLQAKGTMAYIKHFALNDQESQRFGIAAYSNEQALREISLKPFEYAVVEGGAMSAMTSFSRIGIELAPASKGLMHDYLQGELGMKGVSVTDMYSLNYIDENMPYFLMAGTDLPDGKLPNSVFDQYKKGYADFAWRMRDAAKRACYHTVKSSAMNGFDENTKVVSVKAPWEKTVDAVKYSLIAFFSVASALTVGVLAWNALELLKKRKEVK